LLLFPGKEESSFWKESSKELFDDRRMAPIYRFLTIRALRSASRDGETIVPDRSIDHLLQCRSITFSNIGRMHGH
jgi:hypothetical protein